MWPHFKLLFSRAYWASLTRPATWTATWVALRRAHKDRRSWKHLARQLYLLSVPFAVVLWLVGICTFALGGAALAWAVMIVMFVLGKLAYGGKRKGAAKPMSAKLGEELALLRAGPDVARELAALCLVHAVLTDRAASERFVKTKVLPEGMEVITRRRHIAILREAELYDRLGPTERDLLLLPDGHWPDIMVYRVGLALEPLRVLRWTVRIDHFLPAPGETLLPDYRLASSLLEKPAEVLRAERLASDAARESAENTAKQFFFRCWAELLDRRVLNPKDEEQAQWAAETVSRFAGKEGDDYLLGTNIVSKSDNEWVDHARLISGRRWQLLEWIGQRINGKAPALEQLRVFYLGKGYLGLQPEAEPNEWQHESNVEAG